MDIIPAIDLRGGYCVRLLRGDFSQEEIFSDSPENVAQSWVEAGATLIHVVDLDGALNGSQQNFHSIAKISATKNAVIQVGGGIRDLETAQKLINIGASRLVLGTTAIENPKFVELLIKHFTGNSIVVALDVRGRTMATRGWKRDSQTSFTDLADRMANIGVNRFILTDIHRDGTLTEPNFATLQELVTHTRANVIASGGISSIEQLSYLSSIGIEGAIIGKALYTGAISLRKAIEAGL